MQRLKTNNQSLIFIFAIIINLMLVVPAEAAPPPEIRFDILKTKMFKQLYAEEYRGVLKTIEEIKKLGIPPTDSMLYVEGKALLRIGKISEAKKMLEKYLNKAGRFGEYYKQSIELLIEVIVEEEKAEKATRRRKEETRRYNEKARRRQKHKKRFKSYDNGIVYDSKIGLEWYVGPDRYMEWEDAKSWIKNLSVGGGRWRLPTRDELKSLYMEGVGKRNMSPLLKTSGWYVWSGETNVSSAVWYFDFKFGDDSWYDRFYTHDTRVFAVRSRKK